MSFFGVLGTFKDVNSIGIFEELLYIPKKRLT